MHDTAAHERIDTMMDMKSYGLTDRFAALSAEYPDYTVARVIAQEKGRYRIITESGEQSAEVSGKFRYQNATASAYPVVGDFVMTTHHGDDTAVIHTVLARKSIFIRRAAGTGKTEQAVAANVDTLFLCMALNHDFNLRRLERYLSIAWDSGATPVVVLTKADLCNDLDTKLLETEQVALGADIVVTSSMEDDGIKKVLPYLGSGQTVALIGSSGIGKSTLINRLLGEERIATNGLRNDDKGRHTTTHRELMRLPQGGIVIDTPGMRELGIWDSGEGISTTFIDIETLSLQCKFNNCTHHSEPGCAVIRAMKDGTLSEARYASYCKLSAENQFAADSQSYLEAKEKKFKTISAINKHRRNK